jgi:hypothetical protein
VPPITAAWSTATNGDAPLQIGQNLSRWKLPHLTVTRRSRSAMISLFFIFKVSFLPKIFTNRMQMTYNFGVPKQFAPDTRIFSRNGRTESFTIWTFFVNDL